VFSGRGVGDSAKVSAGNVVWEWHHRAAVIGLPRLRTICLEEIGSMVSGTRFCEARENAERAAVKGLPDCELSASQQHRGFRLASPQSPQPRPITTSAQFRSMSRATLLLDLSIRPFVGLLPCIEGCSSWGGLASSSSNFLQLCDLHQYSSLGYICCHKFLAKLLEAKGRFLGHQTSPSLLIPSSLCNAISVVLEAKHS
jgi:hypothetical protein